MIFVESLIKNLKRNNINFFTGVPDSILKKLSYHLEDLPQRKHIIATNEGAAVSIGIGYHLATKKIPCIYLQNSGLSNAMNPLISIANSRVYSIPLVMIIGWRGSPYSADEPQHLEKGKITTKLLRLLNIKYCILKNKKDLIKFNRILRTSKKKNKIVAGLICKGTLETKKKNKKKSSDGTILRSYFIKEFLNLIPKKSKIISTTGYTSRELMQIRTETKNEKGSDFYMVGGMGHTSSVATGYAMMSNSKVFCLDGDGSMLMHLGSLRTIGFLKKNNLKYIVLNNNSHESVGGQKTTASGIDFYKLGISLGFKKIFRISKKNQIKKFLKMFIKSQGSNLLEVKIKNQSLKNLIRPKNLIEIKKNFMKK